MSYYSRKLLIGTVGIYVSYISLSYMAQKLVNTNFKSINSKNQQEQIEKFQHPSLVTWIGCLFCSIYGLLYAHYIDKKPNLITHKQRVRLGLLYTLNYLPTNYALLYISYPLQVVAKNTRYILVVIVGIFFSRVQKSKELKLPFSKLFIGIFISLGAGLFMFYETKKEVKQFHLDPMKRWIGFVLLLVAIISDALFSDTQAYCKSTFKPTPNQLFLASNLYGFVFIFLFALLMGQLRPSLQFCMKHPVVIMELLLIGFLQVMGQISVYYVISNFKQHIYPLISTTRKILTILVSIIAFHHKLNSSQWLALAIVFLSMVYELYDEIKSQEHHRQVRKRKLEKSYVQESELHQSSKLMESEIDICYKAQDEVVDLKASGKLSEALKKSESVSKNRSMRGSRESKLSRINRFINKDLLTQSSSDKRQQDSLSKYRYNWRVGEVVEDRETSLSPIKKIADI